MTPYVLLILLNCMVLTNRHKVMPIQNPDPEGHYLSIKDHKIYYEKSGSGQAILLIHGGYLDMTMWDEQVDFLNNSGFLTIRFDDIGHGKSISGNEKVFSYEIIEALLARCELQTVSIVGLSWGTMMAVDYSLKHPEKVHKLVLLSPGLSGWDYFKDERAKKNFELRQMARTNGDKDVFVEYFQKNWTDGPSSDSLRIDPEIRDRIQNIMIANMENHWNEDWSSLEQPPAIEKIKALKPETLIVTGNLDALDIQLIAEKLDSEVTNSKRIEIKNVAHTLNLERPKKVNKLIRKFLKK